MAQRRNNTEGFGATVKRGWNSKPTAIAAIVIVVLLVIVVLVSTLLGVFAPADRDDAAATPAESSEAKASGETTETANT